MIETSKKFCKLAAAQHPDALVMLQKGLAKGDGALGAALALGIGKTTLFRIARGWPKLRKVLDGGLCSPDEISARGVAARMAAAKPAKKRRRK